MQTWTCTTYWLTDKDRPTVCRHSDTVTLFIPGYELDGRGFTIHFTPAHIGVLQEVVAQLLVVDRAIRGEAEEGLTIDLDEDSISE